MTNRTFRYAVVALLALACGRNEEPGSDTSVAMDPSMPGMAGMHGDSTMDAMMAHVQAVMDTASPATIQAMMPEHRRVLDSVLTSMNDDMRRMNRTPGADWTALADSLRQGMSTMASMNASELQAFTRAHYARMTRLVQMHRSMMGRPPAG